MARTRHQTAAFSPVPLKELPAAALRAVLREGYKRADFKADILAGLVVGIVALPLAMALSIAVGVAPQHGLYTAIVAGFLVALLGGSRTQVTGPTAAFIVILAPIGAKFGLAGLLLSGLMGGAILLAMGFFRLGKLIEFIPHPVTTGFTSGIAVVIATLQVKDLFGLSLPGSPAHYLEQVAAMWRARDTGSVWEFAIGAMTLGILVYLPRWTKRIPPPLVALPAAAAAAWLLARFVPGADPATIDSRFQGIPQLPPLPLLPWHQAGPGGQPFHASLAALQSLMNGAFAVAMLGAIESLLSAVVADGMARTRHDPDAELLALGVGNLVAPFFGGIPATGAIARTATNIRSGGRSPVAAMAHAFTVLAAVLVLAPLIGYLPMASLAALLLLVAWNMSEARHFAHMLKVAPRGDVAVLMTCFGLTVFFDMVIAVSVGILLAALMFMRRMADLSEGRITEGEHPTLPRALPEKVAVYDVSGPLFFGAAQKAMAALGAISDRSRAIILRMDQVPMMDATGLVALESALEELELNNCLAIVTGLRPQPRMLFRKAQFKEVPGRLLICRNVEEAIQAAEDFVRKEAVPS